MVRGSLGEGGREGGGREGGERNGPGDRIGDKEREVREKGRE